MKKIVNFTGAGLSSIAGCPMINNFYDKAEQTCQMLDNSLFQLAEERDEKYIEEMEELKYRYQLCYSILEFKKKRYSDFNIEDLYRKIDMKDSLGIMFYEDISKKIPLALDKIVKFIAIIIEENTLDFKSKNFDYSQYYKILYSIDSIIITPNYDISFEISNLTNSYLDRRPLSYLRRRNIYYGVNNIEPYDEIMKDDMANKDRYEILKLHGSLNFGICRKCGNAYYFNENTYHGMTSVKGLLCHSCEEKLELLIIPPTMSKLSRIEKDKWRDSYNPPNLVLSKIWNKAYKQITRCEEIRFIGYSFPETDIHMKDFIFDALNENDSLNHIIIVTDKKHGYEKIDFEERYKKAIPKRFHRSMNFYYEGFEKFSKEMIIDNRSVLEYT